MKLISNAGTERVIDQLRQWLTPGARLDLISKELSVHAFAEVRDLLSKTGDCRLLLGEEAWEPAALFNGSADIAARGKLQERWLARQLADWIKKLSDVRRASSTPSQALVLIEASGSRRALLGACDLTTQGLGLTPGDRMSLVQATDAPDESLAFAEWFRSNWDGIRPNPAHKEYLLQLLEDASSHRAPSLIYFQILYQLFRNLGDELDEERIIKSATGIRNTIVWKKLFRFQRDGVIGAIDKLERIGGCIIADSVGLGKTFEALAVIKYYELRNDRVLVLCPKRLRDNWTLYKANDRRNLLAADRFNYDVLNHTDLSREGGLSGDIDLSHVNWGNYDLVVIDESHNFRNKATHKDRDTRYDHLMKRIIKTGVKTKVLMLSATPVNNRLADLKNQIAFMTEGNDLALIGHGIPSIEATIRKAQAQFNRWLDLPEAERRQSRLMDMLGFDYFKLLDMLTIARSRKHVQRYYGTEETGQFPDRLPPSNIKADVDLAGEFRPIREINNEIRRLTLAAYAPLRYVLPHRQAAYDEKYSTKIRGGESFFRQVDREESLIHLLRVNILKRMESSVASFALTIERQLADVEALLAKIDGHVEAVDEMSIEDVDVDDSAFESLLIGRKVKVLLQDVDRVAAIPIVKEDGSTGMLGFEASTAIFEHLRTQGFVDGKGKVQDSLRTALSTGTFELPSDLDPHLNAVRDMLKKVAGKLDIKNADERVVVKTRQAVLESAEFQDLWNRIKHKTTYRVHFDNEKLIADCAKAIADGPPVSKARVRIRKADLLIGQGGVAAKEQAADSGAIITIDEGDIVLPDVLTDLQDRTQLTRRSLVRILTECGRLNDFKRNPQAFIEIAGEVINRAKRLAVVDGIKYQRVGDDAYYAQELFEQEELTGYLRNMLKNTTKSVVEHVVYDSGVERTFAEQLERNQSVKVYAKLPGWFRVPTPLGTYNPDWAVLIEVEGEERLYFVVETKDSLFTDDLRDIEAAKIACGAAHFKALTTNSNPVRYVQASKLEDVLAHT